MKLSIVIFDKFTDIDLFLMWDLFNRAPLPEWEVRVLGDQPQHVSATGMVIPTHGRIEEAKDDAKEGRENDPENHKQFNKSQSFAYREAFLLGYAEGYRKQMKKAEY